MFDHDFPFDPTYGYSEAQMLAIEPPDPPPDFEAFWQSHFERAVSLPTHVECRHLPDHATDTVECYEIEFDAAGLNGGPPQRIGGWLTVPRTGRVDRAEILGHGYGGRDAPDLTIDRSHAARIFPCARGFHRSAAPGIPDTGMAHVLDGITSRDTYIHLGCVADLWAAVTVALELYPSAAGHVDYAGGSFGGGIGALAMPWDPRVRRASLSVPSFGNHPLRLTLPCVGSGEAVRLHHQKRGDVLPVLRYFDAATAATFMDKPTLVSCARFDPAVPPPGQFCVYNALPGEKRLVVLDGGHFEYDRLPEDQENVANAIADWFA